jgi:GNAT superfamily N-acetyltransferase
VTAFTIESASTIEEARRAIAAARPAIDSPTQRQIFGRAHSDDALERGMRKPEWVWIARDAGAPQVGGAHLGGAQLGAAQLGGAQLGVVAGWGTAARSAPWILDLIDVPSDRPDVARALIERATADSIGMGSSPIEINLFAPADDPLGDPAVSEVLSLARLCGYRMLVQRRRYRLEPATSEIFVPPTALSFERASGADDPRLAAIYAEILVGSLDAHDQAALATGELETVARETIAEFAEYDPVESFFLATNPEGRLVGLVVGGLRGSADRGVASFIGVSHRHRGNGYAAQLLGWITARVVAEGATSIIGETDLGNTPMAKAFTAVGYPQTESRIDLVHEL